MKKSILLLLALFIFGFTPLFAQSVDDEITLIQAAFGKDKKMLIDAYMDLQESVAPSFWTVYAAYESERQSLGRDRIKIINDYLEGYESMGEEEADLLASLTLKNDLALSKLHSKYYKKFKKATSALDAAKFMQIDSYIHNTIRNAMQQELPFIGEF
jgi:hypothetical protein